ncbi:hypothetical protein DH2020_022810 [Rehmannia glutinosa]|uniref:CONSTANS-like protein n=1 Tax=Rehmannia glutinosa TaxID=99300 RepID=A0ABR0W531_REHGL
MLCEYCRVEKAIVYCKSDSAPLCFRCDVCVHSANALSRRHLRSLICDKCVSQAAVVRCLDENRSFCQACDSSGGCGAEHRRIELSYYSGCPSRDELSKLWYVDDEFNGSVLDLVNSGGVVGNRMNEIASLVKFGAWSVPSSYQPPPPTNQLPSSSSDYTLLSNGRDQMSFLPQGSTLEKGCGDNVKDLGITESEDSVDMDGMALSFDSSYEMFGNLQNRSRYQCDDGGINGLLMDKNILSVTETNSPHIESALEASSVQQEGMAFQPNSQLAVSDNLMRSMSVGANCMLMNPNISSLGFASGQVIPSSISLALSNITGESSAAEYIDSGLAPLYLTGDSPWDSNFETGCPQARDKAKMRYNAKKKMRTFGKQIRYASRKARADTRMRDKGRFVKRGETLNHDPGGTRDF